MRQIRGLIEKIGAQESVFVPNFDGKWWSNDNAFHLFLDFHPLPLLFEGSHDANRIPHCTRSPHGVETKNLAGSPRGEGRGMGLYCRAIYTAFSPATDTLNPFSRGVARPDECPGIAFSLRPLIRRGPVPFCKASWFRSIEHANAPQFVPDVRWLHPSGDTSVHFYVLFYIFLSYILLRIYGIIQEWISN